MCRSRRSGYTLMELMAVLGLLLIFGAVLGPSINGFYGNTKQKAASDILRSRIAEARAKAMERGTPIRIAINTDKTRIRTAPDDTNFGTVQADNDPPAFDALATEDTLDEATVELITDPNDTRTPDDSGWITVATMRADGSSKETYPAIVSIKQRDFTPIQIQVRGITGQSRVVVTNTKNGSQ